MVYQVINNSNNTFWLMTSTGNWISSHHSRDEAVAACQAWFKCSPVIRQKKEQAIGRAGIKRIIFEKASKLFMLLLETTHVFVTLSSHKNRNRES